MIGIPGANIELTLLTGLRRLNAFLATLPLIRRRRLSATARLVRWQIMSRLHDGEARFSIGLDTQNHVLSGADAVGRSVPMQSLDRALFDKGRIPILIKTMSKAMKLRSCAARAPFWARRTLRGS